MNFKEAMIAHLQGEKVECLPLQSLNHEWVAIEESSILRSFKSIQNLLDADVDKGVEFRLAPRTITVNGVEVPAPESVAPENGVTYYIPMPTTSDLYEGFAWQNSLYMDRRLLEDGLVYLNKEDAIARAKAMLICN